MKLVRYLPLFSLFGVVGAFKTSFVEDDEEEDFNIDDTEPQDFGNFADLAIAFPVVISNISNCTSLLSGRDVHSGNITLPVGESQYEDLEMLFDKVSGYYTVLHASMDGGDGPVYCPEKSLPHLRGCVGIGLCLLSRDVPEYIDMSMYTSYLEMLDRFEEQTWPILERQIAIEGTSVHLTLDTPIPEKYSCNIFGETQTFQASLLQEDLSSTLSISSAMASATHLTHQLLDAHVANASMDTMVDQIQNAWRPICHKLSCDPSNFWDIHFASHAQTMSLAEVGSATTVRAEVRKRLGLERRVKAFMVEHAERMASMIHTETQSRAGRFFDYNSKSHSAVATWKEYGRRGKDAMMEFVVPYSSAIARVNETRATVAFDQVEYRKFCRDEDQKRARGDPHAARALLVSRQSSVLSHTGDMELDEDADLEDEQVTRHGKGFFKKVGKVVKKAAKAVGKAVVKVAKFIIKLFACIGDIFEFVTTGYTKDIVPGNVAFGAGVTAGDMGTGLYNLMKGQPPVTWISLDIGFAIGVTYKAAWGGFGVGVGASCSAAGCVAYVGVGVLGTVNLPMLVPTIFCPFGAYIGDPVTGFQCSQVFGGSITAFCCNFDLITGKNDCR